MLANFVVDFYKNSATLLSMKRNKAFTLMELMIIVVIIALIACMAIPAINGVRGEPQARFLVVHRHNDGTTDTYKSANQPWRPENGPGLRVDTIDGKTVYLNGDVTVSYIENNVEASK